MLSAAGTRRARSLPPSTFSSGSLAGMLASNPRVTRFGPLRPTLGRSSKEASVLGRGRKAQKFPPGASRRSNGLHKMDNLGKKRIPDYTDIAYREAVSRLRYLLAESYTSPHRSPFRPYLQGYRGGEESGGEEADAVIERTRALLSPYRRPLYPRRSLYSRSPNRPTTTPSVHVDAPTPHEVRTAPTTPRATTSAPEPAPVTSTLPPEMMAYIERQEEYIDQLERESHFCRDELSSLLSKVKEVISENEGLQEKQKSGVLRSVLDYLQHSDREEEDDDEEDTEASEAEPRRKKAAQRERRATSRMEGPSIVFESRISELEAHLTQVRIDLKKAQDEAELYKKRLLGEGLLPGEEGGESDSMRHQLENLKREKVELLEAVSKLQSTVSQLRERESDASHRVKRTQESVEHATFERAQSELEVRRLKDELERLHGKLREAVAEQGRRAAEERAGVERRYQQQVEQLQAELATQWDNSGRLQMELEKQRRSETELRREISNKNALLDDMAKETQSKIDVLQGELNAALNQHGTLGQNLASTKMLADRAEREAQQENKRLGAEVSALRERLDRADAETLRARQEALRLSEQLAALDREMTLSRTKAEVAGQTPAAKREQELMAMITNMQDKHVETVAELEGMIQSQNQVMAKLKDECHTLTQKLEDSSARHKTEGDIEASQRKDEIQVAPPPSSNKPKSIKVDVIVKVNRKQRWKLHTAREVADWSHQEGPDPMSQSLSQLSTHTNPHNSHWASTSLPQNQAMWIHSSPHPHPPRGGGCMSPPSRDSEIDISQMTQETVMKLVKESENLSLQRVTTNQKEWTPHQPLQVLQQMILKEHEIMNKTPPLSNSLRELHREISLRLPQDEIQPMSQKELRAQELEDWTIPATNQQLINSPRELHQGMRSMRTQQNQDLPNMNLRMRTSSPIMSQQRDQQSMIPPNDLMNLPEVANHWDPSPNNLQAELEIMKRNLQRSRGLHQGVQPEHRQALSEAQFSPREAQTGVSNHDQQVQGRSGPLKKLSLTSDNYEEFGPPLSLHDLAIS